jgi:hypothetical protein
MEEALAKDGKMQAGRIVLAILLLMLTIGVWVLLWVPPQF